MANSRASLVFMPNRVKINSETYRRLILEPEVEDAAGRLLKNQVWIFQQDSAPEHASNAT